MECVQSPAIQAQNSTGCIQSPTGQRHCLVSSTEVKQVTPESVENVDTVECAQTPPSRRVRNSTGCVQSPSVQRHSLVSSRAILAHSLSSTTLTSSTTILDAPDDSAMHGETCPVVIPHRPQRLTTPRGAVKGAPVGSDAGRQEGQGEGQKSQASMLSFVPPQSETIEPVSKCGTMAKGAGKQSSTFPRRTTGRPRAADASPRLVYKTTRVQRDLPTHHLNSIEVNASPHATPSQCFP